MSLLHSMYTGIGLVLPVIVFIISAGICVYFDIISCSVNRIVSITILVCNSVVNMYCASTQNYSVISVCLSVIVAVFVFFFVRIITKKKLGLADVWFSGVIGAFLGLPLWIIASAIACILGFLYIFIVKKQKIPFIPFMTFGVIIASIVQIY